MKKQLVSALLVGAMTATALVGCGGTSSKSSSTKTDSTKTESKKTPTAKAVNASKEDKNTLSVYAWDAGFNIPALKAAEKAYQQKNPDFKLNIVQTADSTEVQNRITLAGQAQDYSTLPDITLFQDHGIHQYMTNFPKVWVEAGDKADWDNFGQEKLSFSTVKGKHYGYPVDNGTVIYAYRTDLLQQAGYTIDDVTGITWDKWLEIGKNVYDKTGKYLLSMDNSGNDLPYMMLQAEGVSQFKDGKVAVADNEKVQKIFEVLQKAVDNHCLYLCNNWSDYTDQSIQGDMVAGVMNGNWIIPTIKKVEANSGKWAITTLPTLSGDQGYASNGGSSLYITSACKGDKVKLAQDFLSYTFGGGDGATATYDAALTDGGVITCYAPAGKSDVYNAGVAFFNNQPIYSTIVEYGTHVKTVEQSDYHYDLRTNISTAITKLTDSSTANRPTIKDALKEAEDTTNSAIEAAKQ